jgi:hypothetical protein
MKTLQKFKFPQNQASQGKYLIELPHGTRGNAIDFA